MTNNKKGGARTVLPIQYFDPNVEYPPNVTSGTMVFDSPATHQQVEVLNSCGIQPYNQHVGGSYQTITNPTTNRKVSIYSKLGRKIIRQYLSYSH
jgi:hypothetical protein